MLPGNRGPGACSPAEAVPGFSGPRAGPGACAGSCPEQDAPPRTINANAISPELHWRDMNDLTLAPPAVPIQVTKDDPVPPLGVNLTPGKTAAAPPWP